jgi:hypothetical protein
MIVRKSVGAALVVVGAALFSAALACVVAAKINTVCYANHPFIGDTSTFFHVQFKLYFDSLVTSKAEVIWRRFIEDPKNPLGYLHYLIFPRSFLLSMNSHLVFTGAAFAIFSTLLGWAVYKRTDSTLYAAVAPRSARRHQFMWRVVVTLFVGIVLCSCAGENIGDVIPHWMGGLPKDVPPRPGQAGYEE